MRTGRVFVSLILFLGIPILCSIIFFIIGFKVGCAFPFKWPSAGEVSNKLGPLKAIRSKNYDLAIEQLEISLAGDILMLSEKRKASGLSAEEKNMVEIVSKYHEMYPWKPKNEFIEQIESGNQNKIQIEPTTSRSVPNKEK